MLIQFSAMQRSVSHFVRSYTRSSYWRGVQTALTFGAALTLVFAIISCQSTVRFSSRSASPATSSPSLSLKHRANSSAPISSHISSHEELNTAQERLLTNAERWLGTPYRYGSTTRAGTDCSGFVMRVFEESGVGALPRSTKDQFSIGAPVERDGLRTGDLVFFNFFSNDGIGVSQVLISHSSVLHSSVLHPSVSHVGLYVGNDTIIHASSTYGVVRQSLSATYLAKAFVGARRVL
jgi:cell wall-associated NlpC family hydrolase